MGGAGGKFGDNDITIPWEHAPKSEGSHRFLLVRPGGGKSMPISVVVRVENVKKKLISIVPNEEGAVIRKAFSSYEYVHMSIDLH